MAITSHGDFDYWHRMVTLDPELDQLAEKLARLRPDWMRHAACHDQGDLFFPDRKTAWQAVPAARQLCEACSVAERCLEHALADPDIVGVWAGTTDAQRRQTRRERRPAA